MKEDEDRVDEEAAEGEALSTREKIIRAALEVFADKGLHGATVVEIAKAAGITGGALYRYFDSKEEIFLAVVDAHTATMQALDLVRELMPELEPKTALKFIARGMFLFVYSDWDFIRMVIGESVKNPEAARPFLDKVLNPSRDFVRECMELWKEKGLLKEEVDPVLATSAFLGMMGYLLIEKDIFKYQDLEGAELTDLVDRYISMFLEGILT
ncbi:MAG: TetR/AcrR family transcriptional regulator [Actinobacteria bacterium]|jgi:AcrR family transcriptional regulator|nr:MAG: TetR/AcrR family transcriptional regulator [Actinomycetota bacterium]